MPPLPSPPCSLFSLAVVNLGSYLPILLLSLNIIRSQAHPVCFPLPSRSLRSILLDIHHCLCSALAAYFLHSEPDFPGSRDSFAGKSRQNRSPIVTESFLKTLRKDSGGGGGVGGSWQEKGVGDEEHRKRGIIVILDSDKSWQLSCQDALHPPFLCTVYMCTYCIYSPSFAWGSNKEFIISTTYLLLSC